MTISRPIVIAVVCAWGALACASPEANSGSGGVGGVGGAAGVGGSGGTGLPSARLAIESDAAVALMPGDEVDVVVRYTDDRDAPLPNANVSFTLVGRALDSGLSSLSAQTDAQGLARTTLIAGNQLASFQVRVSAAGAQPIVIDVAVSDRGFGNLRVSVPYMGARAVAERRVLLFAGIACADVESASGPDRQATLTASMSEARFIGLPANTSYAALVLGYGAPAVVLAQGCTDGAAIVADQEIGVDVTLDDVELNPWGEYRLHVNLETPEVASAIQDRVREHQMPSPPSGSASPAQRLLTALDETLRTDPEALVKLAAADVLQQLRDPGGADADLQALLDEAMRGPHATLLWLADQMSSELQRVHLTVDVTLDAGGAQPTMAWTLRDASSVIAAEFGGSVMHTVASPSASVSDPTFAWSDDRLTATAELPAVFGALSVELVDAVLDNEEGRAAARESIGCTVLSAWVAEQSAVADACDAACLTEACDRLVSTLVASLQSSLVALDAARPLLTIDATMEMTDSSADATVDSLVANMCTARWSADPLDVNATATDLAGSVSGERVADDTL